MFPRYQTCIYSRITNSLTYYGIMLISSSLAGNRFLNFFLGSVVEYPAAFMEWVLINRYLHYYSQTSFKQPAKGQRICPMSGGCLMLVIFSIKMNGWNYQMIFKSRRLLHTGKFVMNIRYHKILNIKAKWLFHRGSYSLTQVEL